MTTDSIIEDILRREGGFVDVREDRGGCTNYGITLATLYEWRGKHTTCADVQALTKQDAKAIYYDIFVQRPNFAALPDSQIKAFLIDWGVHSGPRTAIRAVQRLCNLTIDGVLGPKTLLALQQAPPDLYRKLVRARCEFIATLLHRDPTQRIFAAGWLRRIAEFI